MLSYACVNKVGKALVKALSPESGLRSVIAIQKRNQCRNDEDNAAAKKQYDEQESQFTDQELNLFKKLFLKYDRDDNCKLDRWEFNQFAKFLVGRSYNSIDLEKVLRRVDENRDGYVTWVELMHHFAKKFVPQQKDRVAIAFNFFDKDNDGRLEYWETKQAVFYLGEDILASEMRYKFDLVDTDQDGKLTWVEFCSFLCGVLRKQAL
ncbi:hypothetical protein GE061_006632 [Apolygus lucorum]|uniref:EF-hand domain-containing protein n=1 Tax=Apolygus lucorum TaxID=248454 RepID=A0A8S9WVS3_APOLU|nr:hypothetical protein GE061_006632 [Apolygus lucorum]